MAHVSKSVAHDIDAAAQTPAHKSPLRFLICGSVGAGKSTLLGRLLDETKVLCEDHPQALDLALLRDGVAAARDRGIPRDVPYRVFATDKRTFMVADMPAHEHDTRALVTGASTADLAILLLDACQGMRTQTRRYSYLVHLLGIQHVVLAVNKMDRVDFSQRHFDAMVTDYAAFARQIGMADFLALPLSALHGANIARRADATSWYQGPSLLDYLQTVAVDAQRLARQSFRLPVQSVNQSRLDSRSVTGLITRGTVRVGDLVRVLPSGKTSHVARIVALQGDLPVAAAGQSVTLTLTDALDMSRGDVLAAAAQPPEVADQFETTLVCMAEAPLLPGRQYWLQSGATTASATITELKYQVNLNTLEHLAAKTLERNAIGVCNIALDQVIAFDPYTSHKDGGGFLLLDRRTNTAVAAGIIHFALRRSHNIHWQALDLDKAARAAMNAQHPVVLWFTGLSGAGKSVIANLVEKRLYSLGRRTYLLDGDNVRHGLNRDLGFTDADRVENIRRIAEVAKLFVDAGLIVLTAFISPFRAERQMARNLLEAEEFIEVFVDTPLAVAEARDVKGLYKKARAGQLKNFTGIDSPYETPEAPEIHIKTVELTPEEATEQIIAYLQEKGILQR